MNEYEQWSARLPESVTGDPLWRQQVYRLALFAMETATTDALTLLRERRMAGVADQLVRAVGSVGANIAEGYSRGSGKDRTRFYEYALGSARESRHWYSGTRALLGDRIAYARLALLASIIRLLLTTLPHERRRIVRRTAAGSLVSVGNQPGF